jgi:hypothetical protein
MDLRYPANESMIEKDYPMGKLFEKSIGHPRRIERVSPRT